MLLKQLFMKIIHQNIFPIFNMNCHYCKKNLTNYEIFFKLDHCFCSDTCRSNFTYSFHTQSHQHHPYHFEMLQELKLLNYHHKDSIVASTVS